MPDKKMGPFMGPRREFEDSVQSGWAARFADEESHVDHEQGFDSFVHIGHSVEASACSKGSSCPEDEEEDGVAKYCWLGKSGLKLCGYDCGREDVDRSHHVPEVLEEAREGVTIVYVEEASGEDEGRCAPPKHCRFFQRLHFV